MIFLKNKIDSKFEIEIENLCKFYGENQIFKKFNMKFIKGKITVILGHSGSGKTTLLNIIAGIDRQYSGRVVVRSSNVSYVFQENRLINNLSVYDNISFVLKSNLHGQYLKSEIYKYLDVVEMKKYKDMFPKQLSGGMKRRVSLARSIAYNGDLLLMDEPFKGLDSELKDRIIDRFLNIHSERCDTIIMVTHDKYEAEKFGDIIYSINL
jgi:NitT/TauT family transport system ATP-binding protein